MKPKGGNNTLSHLSTGTFGTLPVVNICRGQNCRGSIFKIATVRSWNLLRHVHDIADYYNRPGRSSKHYILGPGVTSTLPYATARGHNHRQVQPAIVVHFQQNLC